MNFLFRCTRHSAICMWHDKDAINIEKMCCQNKCAQYVISNTRTSVTENLCIACFHTDNTEWIDT